LYLLFFVYPVAASSAGGHKESRWLACWPVGIGMTNASGLTQTNKQTNTHCTWGLQMLDRKMKMYRLEQAPRYTKADTTVIPKSPIPIPSADATGEAR